MILLKIPVIFNKMSFLEVQAAAMYRGAKSEGPLIDVQSSLKASAQELREFARGKELTMIAGFRGRLELSDALRDEIAKGEMEESGPYGFKPEIDVPLLFRRFASGVLPFPSRKAPPVETAGLIRRLKIAERLTGRAVLSDPNSKTAKFWEETVDISRRAFVFAAGILENKADYVGNVKKD